MSLLLTNQSKNYSTYDVQLEDILQRLCASLQLSPSHYKQAETAYLTVAAWLQGDPIFNDCQLEIYPQGSVRSGTTVKPGSKEEFDVDLVLEIHAPSGKFQNPMELLNHIERRMRENKTYNGKIKRKNRCIQLQYANQFHLDILPAIPVNVPLPDCVKVPDCETQGWKPSNPKGYAEWFDIIANDFEALVEMKDTFEKSAKIADLPEQESLDRKPPLKRAVQLIKHYRNRYFDGKDIKPPISIVLTTLAAQQYKRQGSVYLAVAGILDGINNAIQSGPMLKVYNPKNPGELLSERWEEDPQQYHAFKQFCVDFSTHWHTLPKLEGTGMMDLNKSLGSMFDPNLIQESFKKQAEYQQALRENGKLRISAIGQIAAASANAPISIPRNTFYGTQ